MGGRGEAVEVDTYYTSDSEALGSEAQNPKLLSEKVWPKPFLGVFAVVAGREPMITCCVGVFRRRIEMNWQ